MVDSLIFGILPYVAVALAVIVGLNRYFNNRFSYSSLSSQFLENRQQFWGSVPWHYGIILVLSGHLLAFLFPGVWGSIVAAPARLYVIEITGIALGLLAVFGILGLIIRRFTNPRIRAVTSVMDWVLLAALLFQVVTGVLTALIHRWGSVWFLETAQPWLGSLFSLYPQVQLIEQLPLLGKLHIIGAIIIVALFPFTRLVHIAFNPFTYLTRPYQQVIWNRKKI